MRKHIKSVVATLLLVIFIISSYLPVVAVGQPDTYSSSSNSGERGVVCTTLDGTGAGDYYTGDYSFDNLVDLSSTQLLSSLRQLMTDTHSRITNYDNCRDMAIYTDCENNDERIVMIYTSYSGTKSQYQNGTGWNREHVWPQSLGGGNTSGGGADLHHIRPSESKTNSTRGNKVYGNVSSGSSAYGNLSSQVGGTFNSTYFEPNDNVKGDVARICLYVWVRWGNDWGASSITEVFQSVDVLLEWCALDPVDTWEMGRNEVVEGIQGNRNVFIDYPELAWELFDKTAPENMTTPSGGEAVGGNGGGSDNSCQHKNTMVKDAVGATCTTDGYTGDTYCTDCGEKVKSGSTIYSDNAHTFGEWTLSDDGVTYLRHCTKCQAEQAMTSETLISGIESDSQKILILLALGIGDSLILNELSN